jgi:site-specific recombinase XerC
MGFVGKGGKQRSVALPKAALQLLAEYLKHLPPRSADASLIRKVDGTEAALSYSVINRVVARWTKKHVGFRLTPHKLRHAYGKHCVDRGRGHPHHRRGARP